jgi:hypothetical protein
MSHRTFKMPKGATPRMILPWLEPAEFTLVEPPPFADPPAGGGNYALAKRGKDKKGVLEVVWHHDTPEPWSAVVHPMYVNVAASPPPPECYLTEEWLPGHWQCAIYPLGMTRRHIDEWFHVVISELEHIDPKEEISPDDSWHGYRCYVRAARLFSTQFKAATRRLAGKALPANREKAIAELMAHHDAIMSRLTDSPLPTGDTNPPNEERKGKAETTERKKATKGKHINERMAAMLQADPQRVEWSASRWAEELDCSEGTIKGTRTWKQTIKTGRAYERAGRMPLPRKPR